MEMKRKASLALHCKLSKMTEEEKTAYCSQLLNEMEERKNAKSRKKPLRLRKILEFG